jgi:hypothetical protein
MWCRLANAIRFTGRPCKAMGLHLIYDDSDIKAKEEIDGNKLLLGRNYN